MVGVTSTFPAATRLGFDASQHLLGMEDAGVLPAGELELEASFQEPAWSDSAALEDQLCLRSQEEGAEFEHPRRCREAEPDAGGLPEEPREVRLRQWMRGGVVPGYCVAAALRHAST